MKSLSLRQPWASLVALGVKTIETRSWSTSYRGRLAIHAARRRPPLAELRVVVDNLDAWNRWYAAGLVAQDYEISEGPLGAIVATCTLTDVVPMLTKFDHPWPDGLVLHIMDERPWLVDVRNDHVEDVVRNLHDEAPFGDFTSGRFAWLLDDVKPTTERCPACWSQFEGRVPGHTRGSNWPWVPCPTCNPEGLMDPDIVGCPPVPARGRQGLWDWTP